MLDLEEARKLYGGTDGIHDFDHVERVYYMAKRLAIQEGADLEIVLAAALLHDVADSQAGTKEREQHHIASAEVAARVLAEEGWPQERTAAVQHCIRAHRYRSTGERPQTLEAKVLYDADKLDVLGAIGVARTIAYSAQTGQPYYAPPSEQFLKTGVEMEGEPHSAYHEHLFKLSKIKDALFTASARAIAEERHRYLDDYFKRLIAEIQGKL